MAAPSLPPLPSILKQLQHYLKTANEYDKRDPVVSYYCRLYAVQKGIKIDSKSTDSKAFLFALMDDLEKTKKILSDKGEESISNEIVGNAHMEETALKLFQWADTQDRASNFNKNVVKSFYTSGLLFDTLAQFGEPNEEVEASRKYAKWKAAYLHKCLKSGETPVPGPVEDADEEGAVAPPPPAQQPVQPPSNMNLAPETNLYQVPGAHAPPSTPQDFPPPTQPAHPVQPQISPRPVPRATPQPQPTSTADWQPPPNPYGVELKPLQYQKGMKYCKYAISAMQYEDSANAIDNLNKALRLLTTGQDS